MDDFSYLRTKMGMKYDQHPEISFERVKKSLVTLEREDAYEFVCRVLSAVLLLGNLQLYESENEGIPVSIYRFVQNIERLGIGPHLLLAAHKEGHAGQCLDLLPH